MKDKIKNIMNKLLNREVIMYIIFGVLTTLVNLIISFVTFLASNILITPLYIFITLILLN